MNLISWVSSVLYQVSESETSDKFKINSIDLLSQILQEIIATNGNPNPEWIKNIHDQLKESLAREISSERSENYIYHDSMTHSEAKLSTTPS